jgi:hypothetical protein
LAQGEGSVPATSRCSLLLAIGEHGVIMMTEARGASNAKAKRELGWQPLWPRWRDGFRKGLERHHVDASFGTAAAMILKKSRRRVPVVIVAALTDRSRNLLQREANCMRSSKLTITYIGGPTGRLYKSAALDGIACDADGSRG